jgi:hypothetical protein
MLIAIFRSDNVIKENELFSCHWNYKPWILKYFTGSLQKKKFRTKLKSELSVIMNILLMAWVLDFFKS